MSGSLIGNQRYYDYLSRLTRTFYPADAAEHYRRCDEDYLAESGDSGKFLFIRTLADSLPTGARVADLGCGTGRYLHCFHDGVNVVGVDISRPMLEQARHPVLGTRARVTLVESALHVVAFQARSLDSVYCMGVFGHSWPLDAYITSAIATWLKPSGVLYCDTVICDSTLSPSGTWRSRLATAVAPYLRGAPQAYVEAKLLRIMRGRGEVVDTLCDSFEEVRVRRFVGARGQREDLLCVASAPRVQPAKGKIAT
jgi:SAM-dependent methyltransferase